MMEDEGLVGPYQGSKPRDILVSIEEYQSKNGKPQGNEKRVTVAEIGDRLREAREKKGVTIEQAQKHTHIHSTVLSALEDGRCDDILTPNYVKSFLKEYSNYLGFDHRTIVGEYLTLHPELKAKNINLGGGTDQKRPRTFPG